MINQFGFPPIKYCINSNDSKEKLSKEKLSKERYFANTKIKSFNIKKVLSNDKKAPIIVIDTNDNNNLEIVNVI